MKKIFYDEYDYVDYLNECFIDNGNIYINDILIFHLDILLNEEEFLLKKNLFIMGMICVF